MPDAVVQLGILVFEVALDAYLVARLPGFGHYTWPITSLFGLPALLAIIMVFPVALAVRREDQQPTIRLLDTLAHPRGDLPGIAKKCLRFVMGGKGGGCVAEDDIYEWQISGGGTAWTVLSAHPPHGAGEVRLVLEQYHILNFAECSAIPLAWQISHVGRSAGGRLAGQATAQFELPSSPTEIELKVKHPGPSTCVSAVRLSLEAAAMRVGVRR